MKSDSERQAAYQQRRLKKETRIVLWLAKDVEHLIGTLRGDDTRSDWIRRAILESVYRQLSGLPLSDVLTDEQVSTAQRRAADLGVKSLARPVAPAARPDPRPS